MERLYEVAPSEALDPSTRTTLISLVEDINKQKSVVSCDVLRLGKLRWRLSLLYQDGTTWEQEFTFNKRKVSALSNLTEFLLALLPTSELESFHLSLGKEVLPSPPAVVPPPPATEPLNPVSNPAPEEIDGL